MPSLNSYPIGVFDSGVGGLTVFRALRRQLPYEDFIYLGDMARLPYGTRSQEVVTRYAEHVAARLLKEGIKLLVVACNTASAWALPSLRKRFPQLPCLGVVEPGAGVAATTTNTDKIVVLGTEGTVRSGAYAEAIRRRKPDAEIEGIPCNMLVSLVEEGWIDGPEAKAIVARYLSYITLKNFDTVVLGCTHFPVLIPLIRAALPPEVKIVDSADTAAASVVTYLEGQGLARKGDKPGQETFLVTDTPEKFSTMAERFLGETTVGNVTLTTI